MSQSQLLSALEALANVLVGYAIAVATQMVVFPVMGLQASLGQNLGLGAIFALVSFLRSYVLRRAFNALRRPRN